MGKTLKYVKDFDFKAKPCNYATGGDVDSSGTTDGWKAKLAQNFAKRTGGGEALARHLIRSRLKPVTSARIAPVTPAPPKPDIVRLIDEPATGLKRGGLAGKQSTKVSKVMGEFKAGKLHSGSKKGPAVTSRKQAVAIALSEARKGKK